MAHSMIDALISGHRISKHDGPGPHSGTGTPQEAHAGDYRFGPMAWADALNKVGIGGPTYSDDLLHSGREIQDRFRTQPGFMRFSDALQSWLSGRGVDVARNVDRSMRRGHIDPEIEHIDPRTIEGFRLLHRTVANAPRNAPELWRGLAIDLPEGRHLDEVFPRGAEFTTLGLASFSSDKDYAERWGGFTGRGSGQTPVIFRVRPKSKALHAAPLSFLPEQQEWVSGGTYRIVNSDMERASGVIELVQVEGPKQTVRKALSHEDIQKRIIALLSTSLPKPRTVSKHEGPGQHPGTGTEQSIHSGGGRGRSESGGRGDERVGGGSSASRTFIKQVGLSAMVVGGLFLFRGRLPGMSRVKAGRVRATPSGYHKTAAASGASRATSSTDEYRRLSSFINDGGKITMEMAARSQEAGNLKGAIIMWTSGGQQMMRHSMVTGSGGLANPKFIQALASAIAVAPKTNTPLYRGMTVSVRDTALVKSLTTPGNTFQMGPSSFSSNVKVARRFGDPVEGGGILFTLRNSRALRIDRNAATGYGREREWLTSGRFRVVSSKRTGNRWEVVLDQVDLFVPTTAAEAVEHGLALSKRFYELVSKHPEGEEVHEGTGTTQAVHAGDRKAQPGADKGAIHSPWGLDAMPKRARDKIEARIERLAKQGIDLTEERQRERLREHFEEANKNNPEAFEAGMDWYSDAHDWTTELADMYDVDPKRMTGILASLSANMDWEVNKELAHKLVDTLRMDPKYGNEFMPERHLSQMSPAEVYSLVDLGVINPTTMYPTSQSGMFTIPAIRMFRGAEPDTEVSGPKLRSFYNNLLLPGEATSFTVDTHMMRLLLDNPDASMKEAQNVWRASPSAFPSDPSHPEHWRWGLHGWTQEAARKEADRLGVLPHQLQAVAWTQWIDEHGSKRPAGIGGEQRERGIVRGR